eukprot:snap_masked-scaffold_50-processed-gene-1.41-mRNA-1 protein AED:0.28 eAED:0.28 QI:0/-1/0/1/-1/1/1/0/314
MSKRRSLSAPCSEKSIFDDEPLSSLDFFSGNTMSTPPTTEEQKKNCNPTCFSPVFDDIHIHDFPVVPKLIPEDKQNNRMSDLFERMSIANKTPPLDQTNYPLYENIFSSSDPYSFNLTPPGETKVVLDHIPTPDALKIETRTPDILDQFIDNDLSPKLAKLNVSPLTAVLDTIPTIKQEKTTPKKRKSPFKTKKKVVKHTKSPRKTKKKNKDCTFEGCTKNARGNTGFCVKHGGGKRCIHENCSKGARPFSNFCSSHGGGKRCVVVGCKKGALSRSSYCSKHGNMKLEGTLDQPISIERELLITKLSRSQRKQS